MFIQKIIIPKLLHGIETTTYKIMFQSQRVPYFVRNDHLDKFPKQAIGHNRFPSKFVASHDGEVCPAKWKKGEATLKPSIDLVGKI